MATGEYNIVFRKGGAWTRTFTWERPKGTPVSLTGAEADLQIRENVDDTTALVSLSESSGITLGGAAGTIIVTLTSTQTNLDIENGVYDLRIKESGGDWDYLLSGSVKVIKTVTRDPEV